MLKLFDAFWLFLLVFLRPGRTVHCIYGFFPHRDPGQNPGQNSGQKPFKKGLGRFFFKLSLGKLIENWPRKKSKTSIKPNQP